MSYLVWWWRCLRSSLRRVSRRLCRLIRGGVDVDGPFVDWGMPYDDDGTGEDVWQFPESLLIHYLMRAAAGESVDLILLECEANATHVDWDGTYDEDSD